MKIKMVKDSVGASNQSGNQTRLYKADEIVDCNAEWEINLANVFLAEEQAIEVKVDKPTETKKAPKKKTVKKTAKK